MRLCGGPIVNSSLILICLKVLFLTDIKIKLLENEADKWIEITEISTLTNKHCLLCKNTKSSIMQQKKSARLLC